MTRYRRPRHDLRLPNLTVLAVSRFPGHPLESTPHLFVLWRYPVPGVGGVSEELSGQPASTPRTFTGYRPQPPEEYRTKGITNAGESADYEGVVFTDGTVVIRWLTTYRSHSVWACWEDFYQVHGHPEYGTRIEFHDDSPDPPKRDTASTTAAVTTLATPPGAIVLPTRRRFGFTPAPVTAEETGIA